MRYLLMKRRGEESAYLYFTYICKDCGEKFELLVGVGTGDEEMKCKKCDSKNVEKTISSFSTVSKSSSPSDQSCPTGTCNLGD